MLNYLSNLRFGLDLCHGLSTIDGYLMPNPLYTYILDMHIICKHILSITFLNEPEVFFVLSWMVSSISMKPS